jgi:hypothetical protein
MGLLDGPLAQVFAGVLRPIYQAGTLHKASRSESGGGSVSTSYSNFPCRGMRDVTTEAMRGEAGYTDGDVQLIILQEGIPAIATDDQVTLAGQRWSIASVAADPASAAWVCRGQRA